jgi:hypothetical protein
MKTNFSRFESNNSISMHYWFRSKVLTWLYLALLTFSRRQMTVVIPSDQPEMNVAKISPAMPNRQRLLLFAAARYHVSVYSIISRQQQSVTIDVEAVIGPTGRHNSSATNRPFEPTDACITLLTAVCLPFYHPSFHSPT